MPGSESHDVIVVGGGPAGSVMAWSLAERGVRVAVLERANFPREKVCGDFVEPGGLRILESMQCLKPLEARSPLPITHSRSYIQSRIVYRGEIPYYEAQRDLPPYGYIVPRSELDAQLLDRARSAAAKVYEGCIASEISREGELVRVKVRSGERRFSLEAPLVIGADGTESVVARSFGQARNDSRFISVSQRGYVEGVSVSRGEAAIWFDDEMYPGYGWMFPMADGTANVGVGVLREACERYQLSVPRMFQGFLEKLRRNHPGCTHIRLLRRPLGGIVKTYSGVGSNHFDGALLIGDAGSFVDPMTGEGITPGMESALIASSTVVEALEQGRFDAAFLSRYEREFRAYFDPAMRYLDLCATLMRNRHLSEFWLSSAARGYAEAAHDPTFARVAGAYFGGLELRPLAVMGQVWAKIAAYVAEGSAEMVMDLVNGRTRRTGNFVDDFTVWQRGMSRSFLEDPRWHMSWLRDVAQRSARVMWTSRNPRVRGASQLAGRIPTSQAALGDILQGVHHGA